MIEVGYKLFDFNGKEVSHHDLQDKAKWCVDGEAIENAFVRIYGKQTEYAINPEKLTNKYAPDLISFDGKQIADLKLQSTPFFKAKSFYGIDPTYAVVFNEKDFIRYSENYPSIKIVFWIYWKAVKFMNHQGTIEVKPLKGVFVTSFKEFSTYIKTRPIHNYQQRVDDVKGNAKGSYVCDIRDNVFTRLI